MGAGASTGIAVAIDKSSHKELEDALSCLSGGDRGKLAAVLGRLSAIAQTEFGSVHGFIEGSTAKFVGIPYAKAPIVENGLRFKPPEQPEAWSASRKCVDLPPRPFQPGSDGTEDCLYLSVVTRPEWIGASKLRPVLVWIHGGGNTQGYLGCYGDLVSPITEDNEIVQVSIQYRLGCFGWLCHESLTVQDGVYAGAMGNWGIMDQLMALQWVQQNIFNFGGDRMNVTICGESAGGLDVDVLCDSSGPGKGLFHKTISMSGNTILVGNDAQSLKRKLRESDQAGISADMLRTASTTDLYNVCRHVRSGPAVDGVICFARKPGRMRDDLPAIHGGCLEESNLFEVMGSRPHDEAHARQKLLNSMQPAGFTESQVDEVMALYTKEQLMDQHPSDDFWQASSIFKCRRQAFSGGSPMDASKAMAGAPTYCYIYAKEADMGFENLPVGARQGLQASHVLDSFALFNFDSPWFPVQKPLSSASRRAVRSIRTHIASFAATGTPTGPDDPWNQYSGSLTGERNIMMYRNDGSCAMVALSDITRDGSMVSTLDPLCRWLEERMMGENPGGDL